jgi:hypothetical protein
MTGTSVAEALAAEQATLLPLPALGEAFDCIVARRVSRDCLVSFEGRQYSVPFAWVGREVEILGTVDAVVIRCRRTPEFGCTCTAFKPNGISAWIIATVTGVGTVPSLSGIASCVTPASACWSYRDFWRTLGMGGVLGTEWRSLAGFTLLYCGTTCFSTRPGTHPVRQTMLVNSFSFLPIKPPEGTNDTWYLISDFAVASFLRSSISKDEYKRRLAISVGDVINQNGVSPVPACTCTPGVGIGEALAGSNGLPILVVRPEGELVGIATSFDLL